MALQQAFKAWSFPKLLLKLLFIIFPFLAVVSQPGNAALDSIQTLLDLHPQADTIRVKLLLGLADLTVNDHKQKRKVADQAIMLSRQISYEAGEAAGLLQIGVGYRMEGNLSQALKYANQALNLPVSKRDDRILAMSLNLIAAVNRLQGDYPQALQNYLLALQAAERSGIPRQIANALLNIGNLYTTLEDHPKALSYQHKAVKLWEKMGDKLRLVISLNNIGEDYRLMADYPKAIEYYQKALSTARDINYQDGQALAGSNLADVYYRTGHYKEAYTLAHAALRLVKSLDDRELIAWCSDILARTHLKTGQNDSARFYGMQALNVSLATGIKEFIRDAGQVLSQAYAEKGDYANAYRYQVLFIAYKDSLANETTRKQVSKLQFNYELAQKEAHIALLTKDKNLQLETSRRQRQLLFAFVAGLILVAILAMVLWRGNSSKQKANTLLKRQKHEIDQQAMHLAELNEELSVQNEEVHAQRDELQHQRDNLESTLQQLRSAQAQLIQSEKMASLGELTAGIAHEIQNPLNFVNNFAEVNQELIAELESKIREGKMQDVIAIAADLSENEKKITHHGRRADGIVKNMLQHSRNSRGEKEPTDMNALTEKYLKLAYHSFKAKDSGFVTMLETHYDPNAGSLNILPQEIGRVLLNLFNNAFYAVFTKKLLNENFQPVVTVSTRRKDNYLVVSVTDNGTGIPDRLLNKIFQPFFTTKPAGEGTGLGLSLSYDVVTKRHGGHLWVQSIEGEGSEFILELPVE